MNASAVKATESNWNMPSGEFLTFDARKRLETWLRLNHKTKQELWVRIFNKKSGIPTVTRDDCVVAAIAWGWIGLC